MNYWLEIRNVYTIWCIKLLLFYILGIVKLCKTDDDQTQISKVTRSELIAFEMEVRAANIVRAGESLLKLVSDMKQYLILNDFPSVNEAIAQNSKVFRAKQVECDRKLTSLVDDMSTELYELEEEYYTSNYK